MLVKLDVVVRDLTGPVAAGTSVTVKKLDGSNASLFTDATGGSAQINPAVTASDGRLPGFIEVGSYTLNYLGKVVPYEATSGRVSVGKEFLTPTGVAATDVVALQRAQDAVAGRGGGQIDLGGGTFLENDTLIGRSGVKMKGVGRATKLKLANATNKDLLKSDNYGTTGTLDFGLEDVELDGNKANNSSGGGINHDGQRPEIHRVYAHDFKGKGLYSQMSASLPAEDMEGNLSGLRLMDNDVGGLDWQGPNDTHITGAFVRSNVGINVNIGIIGQYTRIHAYGNADYGISAESGNFVDCICEGARLGQVRFLDDGIQWLGGWVFASGAGDGKKGFLLGDATHSAYSVKILDVVVEGCINGCFIIDSHIDSGGMHIRGWVSGASGTAVVGPTGGGGTIDLKRWGGIA